MSTTLPITTNLSATNLPEGWRMVRFGDVVRNVDVYMSDPLEAGLERYVGLDHLDPESLHVKRWGLIADGTSFTRKFTKGQVLFGKRRAYQRKAAVADFDGICSGDILIFEPKGDDLLPDLLPFIVQSEGFYNHALGTSAGSLSPRTRWRDLAEYEFPLPPKDEQRRIADILWAADDTYNKFQEAKFHVDEIKRLLLTELTSKRSDRVAYRETEIGMLPDNWEVVALGNLLDLCQYGLSLPMESEAQYPIFRMMNIEDGTVVENDLKYVDLSDSEFTSFKLEPGDILFNRTNSADLVGKVGIYRLSGEHVFASYLVRLRAKPDRANAEYLNYYLNSEQGQKRILAYASPGVSQTNINASNLRKVLVPLPPLEEQDRIVTTLQAVDERRREISEHASAIGKLKAGLLAQLLAGRIGD